MWHSKLKAFGIHFLVTALVAALAAFLVFKLWFPAPFAQMMGGIKLFVLVVACDLVLGPLLSLVIYNSQKSRKELLGDYTVVIAIQLAALGYGLYTVAQVRPAFLVFTVDRYVVVNAGELPREELAKAQQAEWQKPDWTGYHTVFVERPTDAQEVFSLAMSALDGGRDLQHVVENYRPVAAHVQDILKPAQPLDALQQRFTEKAGTIDAAVVQAGISKEKLRWLPVQAGSAYWTVLIDSQTALPVAWVDLDPF